MANTIRLKRASGSDPGASDLVTGELAVRTDTGKLFTKKDDNSVAEIGVTGNAATATKLETARTIAGVSFDGSANISLNNNAITNGAGYITATLTNEQVQDIVGGMLTGNTETGITVTYQDGDGTIDFVVGTLNQDTTGNAATATALETARNIGGVSFDGTGNINLPGVNTSGNQDTSGNAATATALATARTIAGVSFDGTSNISLNNSNITNGAGYITTVADTTIAPSTIDMEDNEKIKLGAGDDLQLYHNGTNSFIENTTGYLRITGTSGQVYIQSNDDVNITGHTADENMAIFHKNGAVELYHDNVKKIETASGGVSLTGGAAANITALSDGSTITIDMATASHHSVTLGGNRTFAAPSNQAVGQSGSIFITQDGTGSRTASFNSAFKFVGGTAPTLSTAASAVDRIDYVIKSSNVIHCAVSLDVK